jgi:hypothetical protein
MKRITVNNHITGIAYQAELEDSDATQWVSECESNLAWGNVGEYTIDIADTTDEAVGKVKRKEAKQARRDLIRAAKGKKLKAADLPDLVALLIQEITDEE